MESNSNKFNALSLIAEDVEEQEQKDEEGEEDDIELVKRRISSHPLYSVLVETHVECLKMSFGDMEEAGSSASTKPHNSTKTTEPKLSELDHFMEAYCLALNELKEAMKEPLRETTAFIDNMHSQLKELMIPHHCSSPDEDNARAL